jgi:nicotinamide-nucleotide amidase
VNGADFISVADELRRIMVARGLRLAAAESVTGGRLQALITSAAGASDYFVGGVVAYNVQQKTSLLGVDPEHAAAVNCVSARVAREMAQGVCRLMQADVGAAITGYASPAPEYGAAVPFAHVAIWRACRHDTGELLFEGRVECSDVRTAVQQHVAETALIELRNAAIRLSK